MERQSIREYNNRNSSLTRKLLGFISKKKRDEEKKRMDLWKAMRDTSVERLAAVIASARTEFGDRLHDLCSDAESVLQQMLRENNRRKITLRERLLLADVEASPSPTSSGAAPPAAPAPATGPTPVPAPAPASRLQALVTLLRPATGGEDRETSSLMTSSSSSQQQQANNSSGRRLLSALLWEERSSANDQDQWVAFGVGAIHLEHSRSQTVVASGEVSRGCHRPSSSLSSAVENQPLSRQATDEQQQMSSDRGQQQQQQQQAPEATPMRVSLMSLLREAEDGIILMNRQLMEVDVEVNSGSSNSEGEHLCCVCMGRQKGAAFIPCGHTFCRRCCKELQFARGNCPLCNKEIKDILNLY